MSDSLWITLYAEENVEEIARDIAENEDSE